MISKPPIQPDLDLLPEQWKTYLIAVNKFLTEVYLIIRLLNVGTMQISSGDVVPVDGNDGDIFVFQDGLNTALYLNINGVWSPFNNP